MLLTWMSATWTMRSVSGSTMASRFLPIASTSGCRTWNASPLDNRNSNGSNGRRFNHSRIVSALINAPFHRIVSYARPLSELQRLDARNVQQRTDDHAVVGKGD